MPPMESYDASESTSSASESGHELPALPPLAKRAIKRKPSNDANETKRRKTTYYARKDEIETLQDEVATLRKAIQALEHEKQMGAFYVPHKMAMNATLATAIDQNTLRIAGTQSMMTAYNLASVQSGGFIPLKGFIHLPADKTRRTEILSAMHESRIWAATRFVAERTRFLNLRVAQVQTEKFILPDGGYAITSTDVVLFESGHSLRQVFDAHMEFIRTQEISLSENIGVLTVRESDDEEECKFCQTRLISTVMPGLQIEFNEVMFSNYVDATADAPSFAVCVLDYVDQDDLYPYRVDTCLRKMITAAITLIEVPSLTGGKPTIAMVRWAHARIPPATFPLSRDATLGVQNELGLCCEVIPKIMKERLSTIPPAP